MADPVVTPIPAGTWAAVATNVTAATLRFISNEPRKYSWTYIGTGGAAPTDLSDAVPLQDGSTLSFGAAADVYVYAHDTAGSIRTDT